MSILKVDTINEKTSGNGVIIPGHILQAKRAFSSTTVTVNASAGTGASVTLNRLGANSNFIIIVAAAVIRPATSGWHNMGYNVNGSGQVLENVKDDNSWATQTITFLETSLTNPVGASLTFNAINHTSVAQNDQFKNSSILVMEVAT